MENQNNSPQSVLNQNTQTSDQTIYSPQLVVPGSQFAPQVLEQNEDVVTERTVNDMLESEFMAQKRVKEHNNGGELSISEDALAPRYRIGKNNKLLIGLASLAVIILLGLGGLTLSSTGNKKLQLGLGISDQSVSVLGTETTDSLKELTDKGSDYKLIVNGDIVSTSGIAIASGNSWGQLVTAKLSADQRYLLPDASGTVCLDSNNCKYANEGNVVNSIGGQGGAIKLGSGLTMQGSTLLANSSGETTSINSLTGSITLLGVNNRTSISSANNFITITTPQDISTSSSPSFQTLSLATAGMQGGNLICDQSNNCGFSTVTNAFVQDGNSFGASAILGTNDGNNLVFETNNVSRVTIDTTGNVGISAASNGAKLYVPYQNGDLGGVIHGSGYIFGSGGQALIIAGDMTNSSDNPIAIAGESYSATAITGSSVTGSGVYGESQDNYGVSAVSVNNTAIMGLSVASGTSFAGVQGMNWNDGYGVRGDGVGLFGPSNAIGVGAFGTNNYGLYASSSSNTSAYFQASKRTPTCFPFVCPVPPPDVYPTQPTVVIQQFETRTEDLLELQLSDNTPIFQIGYNGHTALGSDAAINGCTLIAIGSCNSVMAIQETVSDFSSDYNIGSSSSLLLNASSVASNTVTASSSILEVAPSSSDLDTLRSAWNVIYNTGTTNIAVADPTKSELYNFGSGTITFATALAGGISNMTNGSFGIATGADGSVVNMGSGSIAFATGVSANVGGTSDGSIGTATALNAKVSNFGIGNIDTVYGLRVETAVNTGGGTVNNNYGIFVNDQSVTGSINSYNVYSSGANANNYFEGNVGIGGTGVSNRLNINTLNTTDPDAQLAVSTGVNNKKGIVVQGMVGQTANLQEWQDSTGAVLASINADGDLYVKNAVVDGNLYVYGHILTDNHAGGTTTAVASAGAGAGATVNITGDDVAGEISITTGTGSSAAALATINFANAYDATTNPSIVLTPKNGSGASIQYFIGSTSNTAFTIDANNAPSDATTYEYYYHVIQHYVPGP